MYFVYLVTCETCVTIYADSYSVNNHHLVAVVLQEASLKMGPNQSLKCIMFQYVQWRRSEKCESSNVIHHCENPIEWYGCSASSVLFRLGSIPFSET